MTQPATLTTAQLDVYLNRINTGGVTEAVKVYQELQDKGYRYAGWAKGVATGDSFTGTAALTTSPAPLGWAWVAKLGRDKTWSETNGEGLRGSFTRAQRPALRLRSTQAKTLRTD